MGQKTLFTICCLGYKEYLIVGLSLHLHQHFYLRRLCNIHLHMYYMQCQHEVLLAHFNFISNLNWATEHLPVPFGVHQNSDPPPSILPTTLLCWPEISAHMKIRSKITVVSYIDSRSIIATPYKISHVHTCIILRNTISNIQLIKTDHSL